MSFAVLLGAVLGSTAIKSGSLVAAVLALTAGGIALLNHRKAERRELEQQKRLVSLYCKLLYRQAPTYELSDWDETFVIDERGDSHERVRVRARALCSDLRFIRLRFGCGWDQPTRFRKRARMSVRNILVDDSPGTALQQTTSWNVDGTLDVMIHFPEPPDAGSEVSFVVDLVWPGRCAPLIDQAPDAFSVAFKQRVAHVRYLIIAPPGASTYSEPIGQRECSSRYRLIVTTNDEGREHITFETFDLRPKHRVGVRLEIRDKTAHDISAKALPRT